MTNYTTPKQAIAIGLAVGLWAVETWFLVDAAGYSLTPSVAAIPLATACLAYLPLAIEERSAKLWVKAAMLACFAFLGAHVVTSVVERTGGAIDAQVSKARTATEARKLLEGELETARQRLTEAEAEIKAESRNGGCKATCEKWRQTARERQDRVTKLTEEIKAMPAYVVGDSVAYRMGKMFSLTEETISLWRPVMLPFGCMLGIWSLAGFGFHRSTKAIDPKWTAQTSFPAANDGLGGLTALLDGTPPKSLPPTNTVEPEVKGADIIEWSQAFHEKHGRWPTKPELIAAYPEYAGTKYSTAWRRLKQAQAA